MSPFCPPYYRDCGAVEPHVARGLRICSQSCDPANPLSTSLDGTGTTNYSFDGAGNQTQVVAPGGAVTTSVWDDENRRTLVIEPAGGRRWPSTAKTCGR